MAHCLRSVFHVIEYFLKFLRVQHPSLGNQRKEFLIINLGPAFLLCDHFFARSRDGGNQQIAFELDDPHTVGTVEANLNAHRNWVCL